MLLCGGCGFWEKMRETDERQRCREEFVTLSHRRSLALFFQNGSLTSAGTPRWLGHTYSCMGGTWKEKAQRQDEEYFALMQPRYTAHAVIQDCVLDHSGRCRLETAYLCSRPLNMHFCQSFCSWMKHFPTYKPFNLFNKYILPPAYSQGLYQSKWRHFLRSLFRNSLLSKHNKIFTLMVDCDWRKKKALNFLYSVINLSLRLCGFLKKDSHEIGKEFWEDD